MSDDVKMTCDAPGCEALADLYADALVSIDAHQGEHDSHFLCSSHARLVVERLQLCKSCRAATPGDEPSDGRAVLTFEPESAAFKAAAPTAAWDVCAACSREAWALVVGPNVVVPF